MLYRGPMGGGAASGKLGALVASHNSGGQYLRARVTPTNTNTSFQSEVRDAVRTLSPRWSTGLTDDQRAGWEVYGENVKKRNRLGDSINISGISHYIRSNASRIQAGLAIIDDAPQVFDLGDLGNPGTLTVGPSSSNGTLNYDSTAILANGGTNNTLLLYVSRPQNLGKNFFAGPYRLAATVAASTTGTASFTLPFAAGPTGTQRFFARYRVSRQDARLTSDIQVTATP